MKSIIMKLIDEECGQDMIEYALVAALIGLSAGGAMKGLANAIKNSFNGVGTSLTNA
jgi:pilus assembly protein Flp/PilA